eukprot:1577322-Amphidinium_carterae.1
MPWLMVITTVMKLSFWIRSCTARPSSRDNGCFAFKMCSGIFRRGVDGMNHERRLERGAPG